MTPLAAIMHELHDGLAALDARRAVPGSDQDRAFVEDEARVYSTATHKLDELLDLDPRNAEAEAAYQDVMRPTFAIMTRLALFKRRDDELAAHGFATRMEIDKVFHEMDAFQDSAKAGDRAAMTALRDLSLKAELFAEQGEINFPESKYRFQHLRTFSREMAEGWQEDLTDMERQ